MDNKGVQRWRPMVVPLFVHVVLALGVYYGLRAVGVDAVPALLVGAVPPALRTAWKAVRERRVDALGVLVLGMLAASMIMTAVTGDARVLLARESWATAFIGVWVLGSLLTARPAILALATEVMPVEQARALAARWQGEPGFRANVVRVSALWGGAFLLDALARVWMAFALPVDAVPGTSSMVMVALLVVVALVSRRMVRAMVWARA